MKLNRIGRLLVCLVLICALVVNISPIKAEATGAGAALGVIKGASLVSVPVAFWAAAALIAIGVTVDWATDPNYNSYDALVNNVSTFLTDAGTYVKDGMVDMYRVVDETGKAVFYAAGDAMEAVRSWLFDSGVLFDGPVMATTTTIAGYTFTSSIPVVRYAYRYNHYGTMRCYWGVLSYEPFSCVYTLGQGTVTDTFEANGRTFYCCGVSCVYYDSLDNAAELAAFPLLGSGAYHQEKYNCHLFLDASGVSTSSPFTLGNVSTVPIDGTGAREWSEEYTNNGLYIVGTGGSGNNNPNDGKWFWPLALGLTAAELYLMSQADQWAGETPEEFTEYVENEQYTVSPGQEVEFGQSLEISPSTGTDSGAGSVPGTGGESEIKTDYTTWFQQIVDWFSQVYEGIVNLPGKIADAFKSLLQELFVPDPEFIPNKVEALKAEYKFLDPMLSTGEDLKLFFQNIGSQPPIIWIDLGAGTGWYPMGGKVKFIDLTWYSQYKPTMDTILAAFIWLWLAWRLFKAVPGLIAGDSGTVGAPTVAPDITFNLPRLPSGRSIRKKDGE